MQPFPTRKEHQGIEYGCQQGRQSGHRRGGHWCSFSAPKQSTTTHESCRTESREPTARSLKPVGHDHALMRLSRAMADARALFARVTERTPKERSQALRVDLEQSLDLKNISRGPDWKFRLLSQGSASARSRLDIIPFVDAPT